MKHEISQKEAVAIRQARTTKPHSYAGSLSTCQCEPCRAARALEDYLNAAERKHGGKGEV